MNSASFDPAERARKTVALIFRRLASAGQASLAEKLSVSESTVSRWKSEQAEQCARILAELGLKVVPETMRCYEPSQMEAILALAKARLAQIEHAEQLAWDDPE